MNNAFIGPARYYEQSPCPVCGHALTGVAAAALENPDDANSPPDKNSFSICLYCATILRFENATQLRKATPDDLVELLTAQPDVFTLLQRMTVAAKQRVRERQRGKHRSN